MDKTITYRNARIHYRIYGAGQPVVLLHGFAEDGEIWTYQASFLKEKYLVIVPDIPGSGKSEMLEGEGGEASLLIPEYASCIRAILSEEGILRCTIIGHSMGGYITLAFASQYPGCLEAFGLFHSTAYGDTQEKIVARKKSIGLIREYGVEAFLNQAIPPLFAPAFLHVHPDETDKLIKRGTNFSAHALVQYYEAMMARPDRTDLLKTSQIPVLFVIGEEDKLVNLQDSLSQCHLPARAHVHILPQAAHMGMWECRDASNIFIMNFLDQINAQ